MTELEIGEIVPLKDLKESPFRYNKEFMQKRQEQFDLKYISYRGKEIHVTQLKDRSVTPEQYKEMRMNSYAKEDFFAKMSDELLLQQGKLYQAQCSRPTRMPSITYDDAVIHDVVPELLKRLEDTLW